MARCSECGGVVADDLKFCGYCGARLNVVGEHMGARILANTETLVDAVGRIAGGGKYRFIGTLQAHGKERMLYVHTDDQGVYTGSEGGVTDATEFFYRSFREGAVVWDESWQTTCPSCLREYHATNQFTMEQQQGGYWIGHLDIPVRSPKDSCPHCRLAYINESEPEPEQLAMAQVAAVWHWPYDSETLRSELGRIRDIRARRSHHIEAISPLVDQAAMPARDFASWFEYNNLLATLAWPVHRRQHPGPALDVESARTVALRAADEEYGQLIDRYCDSWLEEIVSLVRSGTVPANSHYTKEHLFGRSRVPLWCACDTYVFAEDGRVRFGDSFRRPESGRLQDVVSRLLPSEHFAGLWLLDGEEHLRHEIVTFLSGTRAVVTKRGIELANPDYRYYVYASPWGIGGVFDERSVRAIQGVGRWQWQGTMS